MPQVNVIVKTEKLPAKMPRKPSDPTSRRKRITIGDLPAELRREFTKYGRATLHAKRITATHTRFANHTPQAAQAQEDLIRAPPNFEYQI
jgi:hypothetical protein